MLKHRNFTYIIKNTCIRCYFKVFRISRYCAIPSPNISQLQVHYPVFCEACKHLTPLPADFFLRRKHEKNGRQDKGRGDDFSGYTSCQLLKATKDNHDFSLWFSLDRQPVTVSASEVPTATHTAAWGSEHQLHGFTYKMTGTTYHDLPSRLYSGSPASFLLFPQL